MAWFGAPLLFGQAGDAGTPALEDGGSDGWWAGTMRAAVPVALSLALAANATAAHAQRVAAQPQDELAVPQYANQTPTPLTLYVADPSVAMPVPWYWHADALPITPAAPVEDDALPPPTVAPWKVQALPFWEADDRLPLPGDEGEAVLPRPVPVDVPLAWLSAPTAGYVAEVTPDSALDRDGWTAPPPAPWLATALPPRADPDELPILWLDEDGYQPVPPRLPPPVLPPVWLEEDRPPLVGDEGEPPAPVAAPWPARAVPVVDEDGVAPAATPIVEDEGTFFVMPVGPTYILLPPPSSGSSEQAATPIGVDEGEFTVPVVVPWLARQGPLWDADGYPTPPPSFGLDEDTGEVVRRLTAPLPLFYDPAFFVFEGDDTVAPLDEDGYQPPVTVPWRAIALLPSFWATDEYPNGAGPSPTFEDEPYRPAVVVAPWLAVQPFTALQPDELPGTAVALSEDAYQPPMPLVPPFTLAWLSPPSGGYVAEVAAAPGDEGEFQPTPPPVWVPVVYVAGQDDTRVTPPTPFWLDEDLDPGQLLRAIPPVWQAQRPVWGLWDVDEARVTPVFAGGATGTGRTHLFLGEVADSASPASAAGSLYVLTGGYGLAAEDDTPLLIETPNIAPLGPQGRVRLRRIVVPIQYDAACTIRVTPIVDFNTTLPPATVSHSDPGERTRHLLQMKVLTACTTVRLKIEVVSRTGAVEVYRPSVFFSPLSGGTTMAMGGTP